MIEDTELDQAVVDSPRRFGHRRRPRRVAGSPPASIETRASTHSGRFDDGGAELLSAGRRRCVRRLGAGLSGAVFTAMMDPMEELGYFDRAELTSWLALSEARTARALRLSSPDHGGSWIVQALAAAEMPALRSLTLEYCGVGDNGMAALVDTVLLRRLGELVIADDTVTGAGIGEVCDC